MVPGLVHRGSYQPAAGDPPLSVEITEADRETEMSTTLSVAVPAGAVWSGADEAFFRLVAAVFPPALLLGATVLLASYDPEEESG
ncbi:MAG: hypothetical protein QOI54_487 [Actinomycetota bacterium]|nr:hypothetical protein [Actinomycetota bacterium]